MNTISVVSHELRCVEESSGNIFSEVKFWNARYQWRRQRMDQDYRHQWPVRLQAVSGRQHQAVSDGILGHGRRITKGGTAFHRLWGHFCPSFFIFWWPLNFKGCFYLILPTLCPVFCALCCYSIFIQLSTTCLHLPKHRIVNVCNCQYAAIDDEGLPPVMELEWNYSQNWIPMQNIESGV